MTDTSELLAQVDDQIVRQHPEVAVRTEGDTRLYAHQNRVAWAKPVRRDDADLETGVRIDGAVSEDSPWLHLNLPASSIANQILRSLGFAKP